MFWDVAVVWAWLQARGEVGAPSLQRLVGDVLMSVFCVLYRGGCDVGDGLFLALPRSLSNPPVNSK